MDSVFEPRNSEEAVDGADRDGEERTKTLKKSDSIIRPGSLDDNPGDNPDDNPDEVENTKKSDVSSEKTEKKSSNGLPKPNIPVRTNGLPRGNDNCQPPQMSQPPQKSAPDPVLSLTPEGPPVIPAYPGNVRPGLFSTKSLSLPKSMSGNLWIIIYCKKWLFRAITVIYCNKWFFTCSVGPTLLFKIG